MTTRSKCKKETISNPPMQDNDEFYDDDVDENGNLKGFIDYECDEHLQQVIAQHNDYICQETLALRLTHNSHKDTMVFDLDGHTLRLHITLTSATTSR